MGVRGERLSGLGGRGLEGGREGGREGGNHLCLGWWVEGRENGVWVLETNIRRARGKEGGREGVSEGGRERERQEG